MCMYVSPINSDAVPINVIAVMSLDRGYVD